MQRLVSRGCLWFAVVWWGVWLGGQLFNALMIVPHFSADLPQSLAEWARLSATSVADFNRVFNPLWTALALAISLALGWRSYGNGRGLALGSLLAAVISLLILAGWMSPTFARLMHPQDVTISMVDIQTTLHQWTVANWGRIVVELDGFICALLVLSRGSS
jgi:hypothetical protein